MSSESTQQSQKLNKGSKYKAFFQFHDDLNDFLPVQSKNQSIQYEFEGKPSVKDSIEAIGVPHTEVDLIIVNGSSVGFNYHLVNGDQASVYPAFNTIILSPKVNLREKPEPLFIVDVNLGKLAKLLRMCGFDAVYSNQYTDRDIALLANSENRIVLTRDRRLLRQRIITHGYWVRSTRRNEQIIEVLRRFELSSDIKPFNRCLECNGSIKPVEKNDILSYLEPKTKRYFDEFYQCLVCGKVYWKGSHYDQMNKFLGNLKSQKALTRS